MEGGGCGATINKESTATKNGHVLLLRLKGHDEFWKKSANKKTDEKVVDLTARMCWVICVFIARIHV